MKRLIKWILPFFLIIILLFFLPYIEQLYWFYKISYSDVNIEELSTKGGDVPLIVTRKLLHSENTINIKKGLDLAGKISSEKLITDILPFIDNSNREISEKALIALSGLSSENAILPLSKISETAGSRMRLGILQTLAKIKNSDLLTENIIKFKDDSEWVIRMTLADILVDFQGKKITRTLKQLISDDYFEVAYSAAITLGKIGENNPFIGIFERLKPESSWIDQQKAIRLLACFPEKLVSFLVARHISSDFKFLAVAALLWMNNKGDERDFSLIIRETEKKQGIVKVTALKTLSILANKAAKKDEVLLTLMRFLKSGREDIIAACLFGIRHLKGKIAAGQVISFIKHENMDLSYEAILTLGSFKDSKYSGLLKEQILSPHYKRRKAGYLATLYYDDFSTKNIITNLADCVSEEEAEALGLFLYFHSSMNEGYKILLNQYKKATNKKIKIKLLEMLSISNDKITTLDLLKIIDKSELKGWERAKSIVDRSFIELSTPAIIDGFNYFKKRQPKNVKYAIISFSSASKPFWDNKDILYLKSGQKSEGRIEGTLLYDDYNSYYYANNENEILQISKDLISGITLSPLYELGILIQNLDVFQKYYKNALNKENYRLAAYFLHKSISRIQILKSEISHQKVAMDAVLHLEKTWKKNVESFKNYLKKNNLISVAGKYISLKEAVAEELEKLDPEEAEKRRGSANDIYMNGMDHFHKKEYEAAILKFKDALDIWPFHSDSLKQIGISYAQMGNYDDAISFYEKIKNKRPNDIDILNNLSLIYRIKGDLENALKMLTFEIEVNPTLIRGRIDAAQVLVEMDRNNDAIELLEGGIKVSDNSYDLHFELAKMYRQIKDIESALAQMNECIKLKPENVSAITYMGLLQFGAGRSKEAIFNLKKAISFDLANIPARLTLAEIFISSGEMKNAEIELNKILVIDPQNYEAKDLLRSLKK